MGNLPQGQLFFLSSYSVQAQNSDNKNDRVTLFTGKDFTELFEKNSNAINR